MILVASHDTPSAAVCSLAAPPISLLVTQEDSHSRVRSQLHHLGPTSSISSSSSSSGSTHTLSHDTAPFSNITPFGADSNNNDRGPWYSFSASSSSPSTSHTSQPTFSSSSRSDKAATSSPPWRETDESVSFPQAQRDAIALLSLSPSSARVIASSFSVSTSASASADLGNPFLAYARSVVVASPTRPRQSSYSSRRHPSVAAISSASSPTSASQRFHQRRPSLGASGLVSAMSLDPSSSKVAPPTSSIPQAVTTPATSSESSFASRTPTRSRRRAKSLERAIQSLGWYWRSDAESIWGCPIRSQSDPEPARQDQNRCCSAPKYDHPAIDRISPGSDSTGAGSNRPLHESSSDGESAHFIPHDCFLSAYAAGDFDLHHVRCLSPHQDDQARSADAMIGPLPAPMPPWEAARKRAICRLEVFTLRASVLSQIDKVRTRLAERVGMEKEETMADILFGEEGWEFSPRALEHHNNLRRNTVCAHVILNRNQGLTVDVRKDWRFRNSPSLSHLHTVSGYPITSATGLPVGGVCLTSTSPQATIGEEEKQSLRTAGEEISRILEANFTRIFCLKMAKLSTTYSDLLYGPLSLTCARLPQLNLDGGSVEPARRGTYGQAWGGTSTLTLDQCCRRMGDAMKLDTVFFAALLPQKNTQLEPSRGRDETPRRLVMLAQSTSVCPVHLDDVEPFSRAFDDVEEDGEEGGCIILQNEFDAGHSHKLPRPNDVDETTFFSCAILMPMWIEADMTAEGRQLEVVLFAGSKDERHVLGVEDLRFLQYLSPAIHATLANCIASDQVMSAQPTMSETVSNPTSLYSAGLSHGVGRGVSFRSSSSFSSSHAPRQIASVEMDRNTYTHSAAPRLLRSSNSSGSVSRGSRSQRGESSRGGSSGSCASSSSVPGKARESDVPWMPPMRFRDFAISSGSAPTATGAIIPHDASATATTTLGKDLQSLDLHAECANVELQKIRSAEAIEHQRLLPPPSPPPPRLSSQKSKQPSDRALHSKRSFVTQPLHILSKPIRLVQASAVSGRRASGMSRNGASEPFPASPPLPSPPPPSPPVGFSGGEMRSTTISGSSIVSSPPTTNTTSGAPGMGLRVSYRRSSTGGAHGRFHPRNQEM